MTQHPQRCETCRHYQTRFEYGNKKNCTIIKERAPSSYQIGIPYHIDIVGCASHSSASEPVLKTSDPVWHCVVCGAITQKSHEHKYQEILEQTRKKAREKALDAIQEWVRGNSETIEADDGTLEDAVFLGELLAKLESLRGGEA